MKNILVLAHDDEGQEARLQAALDLGRALTGHITCLDVTYIPPILGNDYSEAGYAMAAVLADETTRERANKVTLEARFAREDVAWNWVDATGEAAACIVRAAALADVIVLNRRLDNPSVIDMRRTASELIVKSGKPVLAVPGESRGIDLATALVAWDGSPCAAAALRAAVPMLRLADQVTLFSVDDGAMASPIEDAATYLSRYDIHPVIRRIKVQPGGAPKQLLAAAASGQYGYVVMGGFGHLRFTEALFGGVTRTMLTSSPIPVFLAH